MHEARRGDAVAALLDEPALIGHVVEVDVPHMGGRFYLHHIEGVVLAPSQNVHHAVMPGQRERCLADDLLASGDEPLGLSGRFLVAIGVAGVERHFRVGAVVAHGQVSHDIARGQHLLIHDGLVELLGHVPLHPADFRALDPTRVFRFREVHSRGLPIDACASPDSSQGSRRIRARCRSCRCARPCGR